MLNYPLSLIRRGFAQLARLYAKGNSATSDERIVGG